MGFRSSRTSRDGDAGGERTQRLRHRSQDRSTARHASGSGRLPVERVEEQFGLELHDQETADRLQLLASDAPGRVQQWVDEGMPVDVMGDPQAIQAFRERQEARPPEVPTNVERQNARSVQRSTEVASDASAAGSTQVPERVRDVISSPGQSLDASIQRAMEERMGDSLGDVRIHTGAKAAAACDAIDARAFTVGNHVAFDAGEYDPSSPEGRHILAHELAHVRQQTGGGVDALPREKAVGESDPDPGREREAERRARRVEEQAKSGAERASESALSVQRLDTDRSGGLFRLDRGPDAGGGPIAVQREEASRSTSEDRTPTREEPVGAVSSEEGLRTTRIIRKSLPGVKADRQERRSGNVAYAEVHVDGTAYGLAAVSGGSSPGYSVESPADEERYFETVASGAMPRKHDTEAKLLEHVARNHGEGAEGTVHIFTELEPCRSCAYVIEQFEREFEGVEVTVNHG